MSRNILIPRPATYKISELADAAGTTPRTVRFYTAEELLPPPDARGRYAVYSNEHLDRLRLIDRLKEAHQPLNAIRERLDQLNGEAIGSLLSEAQHRPPSDSLDDFLLRSAEAIRARERPTDRQSASYVASTARQTPRGEYASLTLLEDSLERREIINHDTETWQRITLAPGVELNLRLPLTEERRTAIEEL